VQKNRIEDINLQTKEQMAGQLEIFTRHALWATRCLRTDSEVVFARSQQIAQDSLGDLTEKQIADELLCLQTAAEHAAKELVSTVSLRIRQLQALRAALKDTVANDMESTVENRTEQIAGELAALQTATQQLNKMPKEQIASMNKMPKEQIATQQSTVENRTESIDKLPKEQTAGELPALQPAVDRENSLSNSQWTDITVDPEQAAQLERAWGFEFV